GSMSGTTTSSRPSGRTFGRVVAAVIVVVAGALVAFLVAQSASPSVAPFRETLCPGSGGATSESDGVVTGADGLLPGGVTVFEDEHPGVAGLDPELLSALRAAAADAADDGVAFYITSGWRSPDYQNQLLREAVVEYGSEAEAARWVATAETSPHVLGDA